MNEDYAAIQRKIENFLNFREIHRLKVKLKDEIVSADAGSEDILNGTKN